ncbi:putative ureidoglycolate hydrolase [Xylariales sp. AK1849]|nr:putative ureidoglycolate hydrolase [Xylariales sp. AK1849]
MLVQTLPITQSQHLTAVPLTRELFAPFGIVIANPRPDCRPSNTTPEAIAGGALPHGAVSANQGTAIQYTSIASVRTLYDQAPSNAVATPRMTMFVCGARTLEGPQADSVELKVMERHPFTTQTFVPLTADAGKRYLVIVAPSLAPGKMDERLPVPVPEEEEEDGMKPQLPGRGLPDVSRLRAFIATGEQAVTYGAGTWHAPMVALGGADTTIDFVVVQFANETAVEDCQEVALETRGPDGRRIMIRVREKLKPSKL